MAACGCIPIMPLSCSSWCNRKALTTRPSRFRTKLAPTSLRWRGVRSPHYRGVTSRRDQACTRRVTSQRDQACTRPRRRSYAIANPATCLSCARARTTIGRSWHGMLHRRGWMLNHRDWMLHRRGRMLHRRGWRQSDTVSRPVSGRPPRWGAPPPLRRGRLRRPTPLRGRRASCPTVLPKRRRWRDRPRNKRHRFTASSSCRPPAGTAVRRGGGGGPRARRPHASNVPASESAAAPIAAADAASARPRDVGVAAILRCGVAAILRCVVKSLRATRRRP